VHLNAPDLARPSLQKRGRLLGKIQPESETGARKSKENQIKPRKKAWIFLDSFGRIETFQCVTAIPNRNFSPRPNSRRRLWATLLLAAKSSCRTAQRRSPSSAMGRQITQTCGFGKDSLFDFDSLSASVRADSKALGDAKLGLAPPLGRRRREVLRLLPR
jgi:hypothetical protein